MMTEDGGEVDGEEPVNFQSQVDINKVPHMLGGDCTPLVRVVGEENFNRMLTEQEMHKAESNIVDPDAISYIKAPASKFENTST